jgi:hypothetical protein
MVAPMPAAAMKQVNDGAREHQEIRQDTEDVRSVLGHEEEAGDREKGQQDQA